MTTQSDTTKPTAAKSALSMDVRPDGVAVLTYDVPGEAVNTLNPSFADDVARTLAEIAANPQIKAAILVSGKADTCTRWQTSPTGTFCQLPFG